MRIAVVSPVRPGSISGNDVTSERWARRLTELDHEVTLVPWDRELPFHAEGADPAPGADVLVVLHARRCAAAVGASRHHAPGRPVVVGLAGTDLYVDLPDDADAQRSIEAADRLVVLQSDAVRVLGELDPSLAGRASVVHQSVDPPLPARRPVADEVRVVVLAHLRDVKDPLLAAGAARRLPPTSRVRVVHAGAAHDDDWRQRAATEAAENPRYEWLGELARAEALELLASATALACTSTREGGANVVTEAFALGVPVVGTRMSGNVGLLGDDHPGLVEVGDVEGLAALFGRLEADPALLAELADRSRSRSRLAEPATERSEWADVLAAL